MTAYENSDPARVGAAREVSPLAGLQWPAIVAGAFASLAIFVVAAILARACGVWWTYGTAYTRGEEVGAVIWGGVAALIAFWIGGTLAVKFSAHGSRVGNSFMVWAVTVPALVLMMGAGFGPMLGRTAEMPTQRIYGTAEAPEANPQVVTSRGHAQVAAWWALASLACGLVGAFAAGAITTPGAVRVRRIRAV